MREINKNYYKIYSAPTCGVFLDEEIMKKANKILYKYTQEMEKLLVNNPEHLIEEHWSLAYPHGEQKSFYAYTPVRKDFTNFMPKFETKKVERLFEIDGKDLYSDEVKNEISRLLELDNANPQA